MTCTSPTVPGLDAPTNLLDHGWARPSTNCLANALSNGRAGVDEAVFLGSVGNAPAPGHVVLCDTRTALVREPAAAAGDSGTMTAAAYAAASGFRVLCSVPVTLLRHIVALAPADRLDAMRCAGGLTPGIAHIAFGIVGPVPPRPPSSSPGGSSVDQPPAGSRAYDPKTTDKGVHDWLDALGGAVPDKDKQALAQTGDDDHKLQSWFNSHSRGDPKIDKEMPKEVQAARDRMLANDSVKSQVVNEKGQMTRDKLSDFGKRLDDSAKAAKDSYGKFTKDNKTPDAIAQQSAVNASILQANLAIVDSATPSSKIDQKFDKADLNSIVSGDGNAAIPEPLKRAAAFFAYDGQFSPLSNAGLNPGVDGKGLVQNSNFDTLLSKGTSKSEEDSIASLQNTAIKQAIQQAGGDASKVGKNYFTGGGTGANGADKAAAMVQLGETLGHFESGVKAYGPSDGPDHSTYDGEGPSPGQKRDDFVKSVQSRIDTLAKDTDVQKFLGDKSPPALQGIVAGDPALKGLMEKKLDDLSGSKSLQAAFDQKGKDGKQVGTTEALNNFGSKPSFYGQALNVQPDLTKALKDAPQDIKDKVSKGFDDICSGRDTDDMIKSGTPPDQAIMKSAVSKTAYDSVLDPKTVEDGTNKFNDVAAKYGRDQVMDGKSPEDIFRGLGVANADDPGLKKFIEDNMNTLSPKGPDQAKPIDVVLVVRGVSDMMRGGAKFDDAMAKIQEGWKSLIPGPVSDTYKVGVMHVASGLMLAGSLGARAATGNKGSDMQTAAQSLTVAGSLTEGGSKYYASKLSGLKQSIDADKARLKQFQDRGIEYKPLEDKIKAEGDSLKSLQNFGKDAENVGKAVGGVAGNALGLVSGAISAKKAAESGDKTGAGIQGTVAGLNGISSVMGAGEVAAYVVPRIATALGAPLADGALASLAGAGAGLGAAGGVVGAVAGFGVLLYSIISGTKADAKMEQQVEKWHDDMSKQFSSFGIQVPDLKTLTLPANFSPNPADDYMPAG